MVAKRTPIVLGTIALAFATNQIACETSTTYLGSGGGGGTDNASSSSSNTSTSSTSSGGVICNPMMLPPEGSPCIKEGESCSPGCADPCAFCNVMTCMGGVWKNIEVFPAPCLSCEEVCVPVVNAMCANGPPDQASCVQGCNVNQMGMCKIMFNAMLACIGPQPVFTCDAQNRPTSKGCEGEFDKLYACIMP